MNVWLKLSIISWCAIIFLLDNNTCGLMCFEQRQIISLWINLLHSIPCAHAHIYIHIYNIWFKLIISTGILYMLKGYEDVALFQWGLTCFQDLVMSIKILYMKTVLFKHGDSFCNAIVILVAAVGVYYSKTS